MFKYFTIFIVLFLSISEASSEIVDNVEILKIDDTGSNINIKSHLQLLGIIRLKQIKNSLIYILGLSLHMIHGILTH